MKIDAASQRTTDDFKSFSMRESFSGCQTRLTPAPIYAPRRELLSPAESSAPRLIESYCGACGLLIAASPWPELLEKIEAVHGCPVQGYYS